VKPISQHLPKAYLKPLNSDLLKTADPQGSQQPARQTTRDRVIEAEWSPIHNSPSRVMNAYQSNLTYLDKKTTPQSETPSNALVAECYQKMVHPLNLQPGSLLDIQI